MFDKLSLEQIADPTDLTAGETFAKRMVLLKGHPYYGRLKKTFPNHYMSFKCMIRRGTPTVYVRNTESFINFILDIGKVPENMTRPTIGRLDHSKGYFKGNFEWQSHADNSIEPRNRKNLDSGKN